MEQPLPQDIAAAREIFHERSRFLPPGGTRIKVRARVKRPARQSVLGVGACELHKVTVFNPSQNALSTIFFISKGESFHRLHVVNDSASTRRFP